MSDKHQLFLCCSSEAEMWDWVTSFLKAQNNDPGPPVLRRHSSTDISKHKFGTMPLVPIRGDERNSSMLSANQTLRKLHNRRSHSLYFPMKIQHDSLEGRWASPDLPEPLYEEVGDFGMQVLKSLETSFRSSRTTETLEVLDQLLPRLVLSESGHLDDMMIPEEVQSASSSMEMQKRSSRGECEGAAGRWRELQGVCTASQELLLQEMSSAFTKHEEQKEDQEEERPYDI